MRKKLSICVIIFITLSTANIDIITVLLKIINDLITYFSVSFTSSLFLKTMVGILSIKQEFKVGKVYLL